WPRRDVTHAASSCTAAAAVPYDLFYTAAPRATPRAEARSPDGKNIGARCWEPDVRTPIWDPCPRTKVAGCSAHSDTEERCRQQTMVHMLHRRPRPPDAILEGLIFAVPPTDRDHRGFDFIGNDGAQCVDQSLLVEAREIHSNSRTGAKGANHLNVKRHLSDH